MRAGPFCKLLGVSYKLESDLKTLQCEHLVYPVSSDRGKDGGELQDVQRLATLNVDHAIFAKYCLKYIFSIVNMFLSFIFLSIHCQ